MTRLVLALFLSCFSAMAALPYPSTNVINWGRTNVGVTGGIPNFQTVPIYTNLYPTGGDDGNMIRTALANASAVGTAAQDYRMVKLWPGTYTVGGGNIDFETIGDWVVMRGCGGLSGRTHLLMTNGMIHIRPGNPGYNDDFIHTNITVSQTVLQGTNVIALPSIPPWMGVGGIYILTVLDDTNEVYGVGPSDNPGGTAFPLLPGRAQGQQIRVTGITGTNLTIDNVAFIDYPVSRTPQVSLPGINPVTNPQRKRVGIENMMIEANFFNTDADIVRFENCQDCWVSGCVLTNTPGARTSMSYFGFRNQLRDCWLVASHSYVSGDGYGAVYYGYTTLNLVENCVVTKHRIFLGAVDGSSGNVFAHNFLFQGISDSKVAPNLSAHAIHGCMNLFEGNYAQGGLTADYVHGSTSRQTVLRNRIVGHDELRITPTAIPFLDNQCPVGLEHYSRKWNIIGNLLGEVGFHTNYQFLAETPDSCDNYSKTIYKLGYYNSYACDFGGTIDTLAQLAVVRAGNFDVVTSTNHGIVLGGFTTNDIPNSLIDQSAPYWWPAGKPWPAFDPNMGSASFTNILAGIMWKNLTNPVPEMVVKLTASTLKLGF